MNGNVKQFEMDKEKLKEFIKYDSFVIDENTPVVVKELLEDIKLLSNESEEIEEPEFKFIQGFPMALNDEYEQIQENKLKDDIKPPEVVIKAMYQKCSQIDY